jgi:hypothetical protein
MWDSGVLVSVQALHNAPRAATLLGIARHFGASLCLIIIVPIEPQTMLAAEERGSTTLMGSPASTRSGVSLERYSLVPRNDSLLLQ